MKIALGIEYQGSAYQGWQRQVHANTIQHYVEAAIAKIAHEPITVICAGRTDTGVHALEQVIHFETSAVRPDDAWIRGVNSHLPKDIRVIWAQNVDDGFHARFDARRRSYIYLINSGKVSPAMNHLGVTWLHYDLDVEAMQEGASYWLGEHDFSSFRASDCQAKSPVRTCHAFKVQRLGKLVVLEVECNAFLYHQVRNMVGTLLQIGRGYEKPIFAKQVLKARTRIGAPPTASASGLYLAKVRYETPIGLEQVNYPWFLETLESANQQLEEI